MRPSGKLHLGHYIGVLVNWKKLQEEHDCFFFAADWHALTTEYDHTSVIRESIDDMVIDWMASGIDPRKATLFIQSHVPEHAELHLLLSMITPLSWLERNPTYKEQLKEITQRDLHTYGFLRIPGPHGLGHHHVRRLPRPGGDGPAPAPGAHPRDRAAVQLPLPGDLRHPRRRT